MKWLKLGLIIFIIYVFFKQPVYSSGIQHKNTDKRVVALQNFFYKKGSPLTKSAQIFIQVADKYKLNWKLLPSIAGVESGFETAGNIYDYNPFGYMCNGSPCYFKSYKEAIETVAKTISRGSAYKTFRDSGKEIDLANVYNQVSPATWVNRLDYFEEKL